MSAPYLSTALTLPTVESNVRTDLSDTDPTNYRWSQAAIDREVDRFLTQYSAIVPWLRLTQIPTVAHSALYARPAGALWVDRVEYPLSRSPKQFQPFTERLSPLIADPTSAALILASSAGGNLGAGTYNYAYTFTTPGGGETKPSPQQPITVGANSQVALSSVPTGPYGVTGRNIYRTAAGGNTLGLVGSLADNVTGSFLDNLAAIGAAAPAANTTADIPEIEIEMSPFYVPADASGWIEVTYAAKHLLDANGTTVPPQHWDVIHLGAEHFLVQAYLGAVSDNFEWVDGQFRDRVDDTKSMEAWRAFHSQLHSQLEHRLTQLRAEDNDTISPVARWGDKPYRWDRL